MANYSVKPTVNEEGLTPENVVSAPDTPDETAVRNGRNGRNGRDVGPREYQAMKRHEMKRLVQINREFETRMDLLVADRIRERRIALRMTQQVLADRIGIASQQVHRYERAESRITAGRLVQLADALGVAITYFVALNRGSGRNGRVRRKLEKEATE
jgi:ribosome-binding protein aMBF1 (putative translation factor)